MIIKINVNKGADMRLPKIFCLAIFLIIAIGFNITGAQSTGKSVRISLIIGKTGDHGSGGGYFEALYAGKQIEVTYTYSKTKVYMGNKEIKGLLDEIFVGNGKAQPLAGSHIEVEGHWYHPPNFEATKIYLPENISRSPSRINEKTPAPSESVQRSSTATKYGTASCQGVSQYRGADMDIKKKAELERAIVKQIKVLLPQHNVKSVDVLYMIASDNWSMVLVATHVSDEIYLFYAGKPCDGPLCHPL
jgi:hypothetical protein